MNTANNRPRAIVVAGGTWQVPLIEFLQAHQFEVTVVDPYDDSKGVLIADYHVKEDVRNKEAILQMLTGEYALVATDQSDISVGTVAYLANHLHLCGNAEQVVERFSNKYISRKYAQSIGVPIPRFALAQDVASVKCFLADCIGSAIIKPSDSQSSKGIHVVDGNTTDAMLRKCLEDAVSYSQTKEVLIEEFAEGYEITVEGFCVGGKHRVMAMSKKKHFKTGIASSLRYPAAIPEHIRQQVEEVDNRYVEKSGLQFGITHAEYIVNENTGTFILVEIACRGGGTLISSDIVPWVSGFDMYEALLQCLTGREGEVDVEAVIPKRRSAELHFFELGEGEIVDISGLEDARKIKGVHRLDFDHHIGEVLHSCKDDRSRQGFCIAFADTPEQLDATIAEVENTIKVRFK